jgi:hypothetical protein
MLSAPAAAAPFAPAAAVPFAPAAAVPFAPAAAAPSPRPSGSPLPATLDAAKRVVTARIDGRLAALRAYSTAVNAAANLTAGHKSTLTDLIAADQSGLAALRTKVAGETTLAAVKADDQRMVVDYRIYLLVGPKVRLTIGCDIEAAVSRQLRQLSDKLAAAIAAAKQAGKDTTKAEAQLADMRKQLDTADAAINGKADALLAVQPGPDGDAIRAQVNPVRNAVHTARAALRKAAADAKAIASI